MFKIALCCTVIGYAAALLFEVSRLWFRSGVRGALMLAAAGAGLAAHTAWLLGQAAQSSGAPLSSQRDWYLLVSWFVVVVYLYLVYYHPRTPFGLVLLPLALGLIGAGAALASTQPMAAEPALHVWGAIHAFSLVAATVAVFFGFMAGAMYLWQVRRLKHKVPAGIGPRLPSLEWLERTNARALAVSVAMLAVGIGSGVIMRFGQSPARLPWSDPVVISTGLMLLWLVAALIASRATPVTSTGRHVAYLTVASFVLLLAALAVGLLLDTRHGGRAAPTAASAPSVAPPTEHGSPAVPGGRR